MSVHFDLIRHAPDAISVKSFPQEVCFGRLGGLGNWYTPKDVVLDNYTSKVRYKINSRLSKEEGEKFLSEVFEWLGFNNFIPRQTASSMLRRGLLVDGSKVNGPLMLAILSVARYLDEEPHIVTAYHHFMDMNKMDPLTAFVLSHGYRPGATSYKRGNIESSNHVILSSVISDAVFTKVWNMQWTHPQPAHKPWIHKRSLTGVFELFLPSDYGTVHFDNQHFIRKKILEKYIVNKIYPLRAKFFANHK